MEKQIGSDVRTRLAGIRRLALAGHGTSAESRVSAEKAVEGYGPHAADAISIRLLMLSEGLQPARFASTARVMSDRAVRDAINGVGDFYEFSYWACSLAADVYDAGAVSKVVSSISESTGGRADSKDKASMEAHEQEATAIMYNVSSIISRLADARLPGGGEIDIKDAAVNMASTIGRYAGQDAVQIAELMRKNTHDYSMSKKEILDMSIRLRESGNIKLMSGNEPAFRFFLRENRLK